jgi:acyl transferase domain-containing protein
MSMVLAIDTASRPVTASGTTGVALVFAGQGAQHPRMAAGLYGYDEVFTTTMDAAFAQLHGGVRLRNQWLADVPGPSFDDVTVAQPLLYAVNCALGRMVLSWGVRPVALLGHSVGELAAATLAGVLAFEDGVRLMRDRVEQFARTPDGGMLAVAASVSDVEPVLGRDVFLAAVNAPRQLLLSGERMALCRAWDALRARGLACRMSAARQAFHSPVVADAVELSMPDWRITPLQAPQLRLYSAYTEGVLDAGRARDPEFWARQPAEPVLFGSTLDQLFADGDCLLLEAGPGQSLTLLARRHPAVTRGRCETAALLPERSLGDLADREAVARIAGRIAGSSAPRSAAGSTPTSSTPTSSTPTSLVGGRR